MQDAAELATVGARRRNIAIQIVDRTAGASILADKVQIQQVLVNLLRNAVEAVEESTRRTSAWSRQGPPVMSVSTLIDNGPGLPREIADKLFQPFLTTKKSGMGVGLSICRSIVNAHEGRISAEANPDRGTVFRIMLPFARDEPVRC